MFKSIVLAAGVAAATVFSTSPVSAGDSYNRLSRGPYSAARNFGNLAPVYGAGLRGAPPRRQSGYHRPNVRSYGYPSSGYYRSGYRGSGYNNSGFYRSPYRGGFSIGVGGGSGFYPGFGPRW